MKRLLRLILFIAAATGVIFLVGYQRQAGEPRVVVVPPVDTGPRIVFPAARLPRLAMPGDEHRVIRSVLNVAKPMRYGDFLWNEEGVPPGRSWVRIDLAAQTMSIFRAGHEIGTAVILYGADEKPTPVGRFAILAKLRDHKSSLYDAAMPFTLRLTDDGVAIHGSDVRWGAATHGCVGVPTAFARHLFEQVNVGDTVAILPALAHETPNSRS